MHLLLLSRWYGDIISPRFVTFSPVLSVHLPFRSCRSLTWTSSSLDSTWVVVKVELWLPLLFLALSPASGCLRTWFPRLSPRRTSCFNGSLIIMCVAGLVDAWRADQIFSSFLLLYRLAHPCPLSWNLSTQRPTLRRGPLHTTCYRLHWIAHRIPLSSDVTTLPSAGRWLIPLVRWLFPGPRSDKFLLFL